MGTLDFSWLNGSCREAPGHTCYHRECQIISGKTHAFEMGSDGQGNHYAFIDGERLTVNMTSVTEDNTREKLATVQRLLSLYFDIRDNTAYQSMPPTLRLTFADGLLREALTLTSEVAPQ